ncbi:MAG: TonB-dependent receptor [Hydrogenophilales bacterium 17-61-9]|nr:MAG: TonB-dependent receptor [Hydrogenophilales bacterium 17-61-9]
MKYSNRNLTRASLRNPGGLFKPSLIASALAVLGMSAAHAEDSRTAAELPAIVVTALPFANRDELDLAQPVSVLQGDDLRRKREASLGDTLFHELGVTSSAFGPAAGRPIIRGLDGPRIRVLEGGIGTQDISTLSPDHMVTAESFNAAQIEILRGPATLLYGSGASGGVVNVVTGRIPNRLFNSPTGNVELRGNSATDERSGAFNATGSLGQTSWNVDGFKRRTGDYDTPAGRVGNSAIDSDGVSMGGSFIGERGFVGASVAQLESLYGIPGADGTQIDLKQRRYDLAGELDDPFRGFKRLKLRMGYNDYQHAEIEGSGETGTRFDNRGFEGRVELLHAPVANWQGVLGVQLQDRSFSAIGEEAIVPATQSRSTGLFLVEERNWARWRLELGGRAERATQNPLDSANPSRAFNLYSASAGVLWKFKDGYGLGLSATQGQRAPATEELYSDGPHTATRAYQTGNHALVKETAHNIDLSLRKTAGAVKWKANVFHNRIGNYIFERSADTDGDGVADRVDDAGTLDPDGEYLVQNVAQTGARFYGAEAEAVFTLLPGALDLRLFADTVRGKLDRGGNVPRTPPHRFGLQLDHQAGAWAANLSVVRAARQNRLAELETATPAYTLANAEVSYRIKQDKSIGYTVFVQGKNLLDNEIRVHTSYLKDVAPLPGRAFVLGLRGQF